MADSFLEATSAGLGSIVSTSCVYPLEILKSKLACGEKTANGQKLTTALLARAILCESGPLGFYEGVQYSSSKSGIEKFVYFYAYSFLKRLWEAYVGKIGGTGSIITGYLADWAHIPITQPLETVLIRVQNKKPILDERGVAGLYKGVSAQLILCFKNAIQNAVFDQVKATLLKMKNRGGAEKVIALTALEAFLLGALGRAVATIAVWPYQRAKVVMQTQSSSKDGGPKSIPEVMRKIVVEDGVLALYQGLPPELIRGVGSAAIMYMMKEKIYELAKKAILAKR